MSTTTTTTTSTTLPTSLTTIHQPTPRSNDVSTTLNYYKESAGPPEPTIVGKPETYERPSSPRTVLVRDIRGEEDNWSLDGQGFQVVKRPSAVEDVVTGEEDEDEKIKRVYYPEVEGLLKDITGASEIFIFDHTIRRAPQDTRAPPSKSTPEENNNTTTQTAPTATDNSIPAALRGPVHRVHIDQSYKAGFSRVPHHLPNEATRLLKGRHQIINVWRPLKPVLRDPLGVADANSVPDSDLLPVKLIYPTREGETFTVKPNAAHRWNYLSGQRPDEALLIKCFDSKVDGRARRVPHSAFSLGERGEGPARESIEVRALVFHPDDRE